MRTVAAQLASYEVFAVLILALLPLARPRWGVVALGLLVLAWVVRRLGTGRLTVRTPLDWCLLGLLLALPGALWVSPDRPASLAAVTWLLMGLGLFYAVANSAAQGWRFEATVALVIAAGAGLALLGLLGAVHSGSQFLGLSQQLVDLPLPVDIHANVLATALTLALPPTAALAVGPRPARWPAWSRVALVAAGLVMLLALTLTQSRGAYLGAVAALLVMVAMRWRWGRWLALGAAGLAVAGLAFFGSQVSDLLLGVTGREAVWLRALYAVRDFPLTGAGFGLFESIVPVLYPYFDLGVGPLAQATHAHDLFLQVAYDTGLLGLVSFTALLVTASGLLAWLWPKVAGLERALAWGLAGSLSALVVHGLVDAAAWNTRIAPLLWLLLGLLVVLPQRMSPPARETAYE